MSHDPQKLSSTAAAPPRAEAGISVSQAKAQLLAWAVEHDARTLQARSETGALVTGGLAALLGGVVFGRIISPRSPSPPRPPVPSSSAVPASEPSAAPSHLRSLGAQMISLAASAHMLLGLLGSALEKKPSAAAPETASPNCVRES